LQTRTNNSITKIEGVYIFGGMDNERKYKNDLKLIKIGKKPVEWVNVKTYGKPPSERISCSLNYYEELQILIIFGGKNEYYNDMYFNELYIFNLLNSNWICANIYDKLPLERGEHSSIIWNNKLLIYGGINQNCYLGSEMYIINLDIWEKRRRKLFGTTRVVLPQEVINVKFKKQILNY